MRITKLIFIILILIITLPDISFAKLQNQAVGISPLGFLLESINYIEYERLFRSHSTFAIRIDYLHYNYKDEGTYTILN
ncbi:hypothetical protein KAT89_04025 [candidate division WOR-3 bacterium]|jgi:hypothetical protein|nr:hypothetical protein [candidate division WOR-3 bacterium]